MLANEFRLNEEKNIKKNDDIIYTFIVYFLDFLLASLLCKSHRRVFSWQYPRALEQGRETLSHLENDEILVRVSGGTLGV